jgi:hypothetical protein
MCNATFVSRAAHHNHQTMKKEIGDKKLLLSILVRILTMYATTESAARRTCAIAIRTQVIMPSTSKRSRPCSEFLRLQTQVVSPGTPSDAIVIVIS